MIDNPIDNSPRLHYAHIDITFIRWDTAAEVRKLVH